MRALRCAVALVVAALVVLLSAPAASASPRDPDVPLPPLPPVPNVPVPYLPSLGSMPSVPSVPALPDCKEAPVPVSPGQGLAGFFDTAPDPLPPEEDPFADGATTTIYEQYGYAGLRWRTYDLGCGPDVMRSPDAVIGTAVSNWIMQAPIAMAALTGSVTRVAFQPTFLDTFDPVIERVSRALHESLFASWIPAVIALLGLLVIVKARRSALASTAAAIGWALIIVILAVALFRWPIAAGNAADEIVTGSLGKVVGQLDGDESGTDPGIAVSAHVQESILYRSWLAGTLGDPDSETARKYGPELFKAQALTWREAAEAQQDPDRAKEIIEAKQKKWDEIAEKIKEEDPEAYENLTGRRSETRVGYSILSGLATFLALPFLLLSALLMLGCYLIVRLAVMLFPAFAILGAFPSSRGLVTGLGRTVAAAVVNAIIFGIGAGVTVAVLGILFHPGGGAPGWLSLVLMPLFSFIMWQALKPFRRLTTMVSPDTDPFRGMGDSYQRAKSEGWRLTKVAAAGAFGGAAGAAAADALNDDDKPDAPPERAEARPTPPTTSPQARHALSPPRGRHPGTHGTAPDSEPAGPSPHGGRAGVPFEAGRVREPVRVGSAPVAQLPRELPEGRAPRPSATPPPPSPTEPEWYDGEEVYPIYRPPTDDADDVA